MTISQESKPTMEAEEKLKRLTERLRDQATLLDYAHFMKDTVDKRRLMNAREMLNLAADTIDSLLQAQAGTRAEVIEECAKVADGWLAMHGPSAPQYVSARTWANDAVKDIRDAIRSLSPVGPGTHADNGCAGDDASLVTGPTGRPPALAAKDVEWVTNDIAELGVKIGGQFFFIYKGGSLVYGDSEHERDKGYAVHDDETSPMHWRPVFKREFGECIHPLNHARPELIGTVSLDDSDKWKPLPAALSPVGSLSSTDK